MNVTADFIPRFDGREAYWWLIQAEQYFRSRRMSEEMKLERVVAFSLREDALDWWISWKESHPNTCNSEIQEPITLPTEEKIGGKVDDSQIQQHSEKEVCKVDIKSDCESDKVKNTDSLISASEAKVQRSDRVGYFITCKV
ncbi:unnamed protein product [Vicia faba]|uniref:Retrotransposon gag domain-containing protein n=1 Tax=Vicia faba TaxID=3906 RepID=A0AAV0ZQE7_VICFA|nr:unnamed protein product [Vicia faba]